MYLLIEQIRAEPKQIDLRHNVTYDLRTPLSIIKNMQLIRPATYHQAQRYTETSRSAKEVAKLGHAEKFSQPILAGQPTKREMHQQLLRYYEQPPALFSHRVVHTEHWTTAKPLYFPYRKRRFVDHEQITPESIESEVNPFNDQFNDNSVKNLIARKLYDDNKEREEAAADAVAHGHQPTVDEMRYFHDIYMRLAGPHERNLFGHVEHGPNLFEKRFESQRGGNRFMGKILWADKTGGYGEHHWDLAQGKLS